MLLDAAHSPVRQSAGSKRSSDAHHAVLEASRQILIEAGYGGFTIDAIARRARAGKPTIYRWWSGRCALLREIHDAEFSSLDVSDATDVHQACEKLLGWWSHSPADPALSGMFAEAQANPELQPVLRELLTSYALLLARSLPGCDEESLLPMIRQVCMVWFIESAHHRRPVITGTTRFVSKAALEKHPAKPVMREVAPAKEPIHHRDEEWVD